MCPMSLVGVLIVLILVITIMRCIVGDVAYRFFVFHLVFVLIFFVLVLVFCVLDVLFLPIGALLLIVTLLLFPPVIILINVVECGLGCMAVQRSFDFSIEQ